MLERFLLDAEEKVNVPWLLIITFVITFTIGVINYFLGGNSLFLVALVALTLSYPVVNYIRSMDRDELETRMDEETLLRRHGAELVVFWSIFVAAIIGLAAAMPFQSDFTFQEAFISQVTGYVTQAHASFGTIVLNNLKVLGLTFVVSLVSFSALLFVLLWNASIVVYMLSKYPTLSAAISIGALLLPHGLLEIGGYVLAGIAGSIVAYRIDRWKKFDYRLDSEFVRDMAMLVGGALVLVFVGAVVEVL